MWEFCSLSIFVIIASDCLIYEKVKRTAVWLERYLLPQQSQNQESKQDSRDRWVGKVNFVEIRSFWHIFRSFDRMWSFFILCLQVPIFVSQNFFCQIILLYLQLYEIVLKLVHFYQAMIIVAWNGTGEPTAVFSSDVFKKVLSVFITAAILKLGQGG